MSDYQLIVNI